jgi:hypothetical protein
MLRFCYNRIWQDEKMMMIKRGTAWLSLLQIIRLFPGDGALAKPERLPRKQKPSGSLGPDSMKGSLSMPVRFNPHLPKQIIPSSRMSSWLEENNAHANADKNQ